MRTPNIVPPLKYSSQLPTLQPSSFPSTESNHVRKCWLKKNPLNELPGKHELKQREGSEELLLQFYIIAYEALLQFINIWKVGILHGNREKASRIYTTARGHHLIKQMTPQWMRLPMKTDNFRRICFRKNVTFSRRGKSAVGREPIGKKGMRTCGSAGRRRAVGCRRRRRTCVQLEWGWWARSTIGDV